MCRIGILYVGSKLAGAGQKWENNIKIRLRELDCGNEET
jgi:hypothetical protein